MNTGLLPVMHTETNLSEGPFGDEAVNWLWKQWANVLLIRNKGIPVVGFTWYSLIDQTDWDSALREDKGNKNPLGLYDLSRNIRKVGIAYKKLIEDWCAVLPTQSICLQVPIVMPEEHDDYCKRNRIHPFNVKHPQTDTEPSNANNKGAIWKTLADLKTKWSSSLEPEAE